MGAWRLRQPMPTPPRHDLQAVAVGKRIYAISGAHDLTVDVVEIYDVVENSWSTGTPLPVKKAWLAAMSVGNRIFTIGGAYKKGTGYRWLDDVHELVC